MIALTRSRSLRPRPPSMLLVSLTGVIVLTSTPTTAIAALLDLGGGIFPTIDPQVSLDPWSESSPVQQATQAVLNQTGIGGAVNQAGGVEGITNLFNQLLKNPLSVILSLLNGQLQNLLQEVQTQLGTIYGGGADCPMIYNLGETASCSIAGTGSSSSNPEIGAGTLNQPGSSGQNNPAISGTNSTNGNDISKAIITQASQAGLPDPQLTATLIRDQVFKNQATDMAGLDPATYGQFLANESDRFSTGVNAEAGLSQPAQIQRKNDITANAGVMQTITQESQMAQTKDTTQDVIKLYTLQQGQASVILGQMYAHQRLQEPVTLISNLNLRNISRTLDQTQKQIGAQIVNMSQQELNLAGLNAGWYDNNQNAKPTSK